MNECFECKHRGTNPGSAHSCCNHPKAAKDSDPLSSLMAIFASVGRTDPVISGAAVELGIEADPHGIKKGWFNWPWNFDPVWLKNCNGFEQK